MSYSYNAPDINFPKDKSGEYLGRNGFGIVKGLAVSIYANDESAFLTIQPINSKSQIAMCRIQIPIEESVNLIEAIKKCMETYYEGKSKTGE